MTDHRLPPATATLLRRYLREAPRVDAAAKRVQQLRRDVAVALADAGLTCSESAVLLGVTPGRVGQLRSEARRPP